MAFIKPEDWQPQGIAALEPAAMQAVSETARSVCVTASAGAGKTEFLAQKAAYLLQTGLCRPPFKILAISFKRDAAKNLAERVRERCPADMARRFDSLTFDAFTKTLIDRFGPAIPAPLTPSPAYRIGFPRTDDYQDFLVRNGQRNLNTQSLAKHIANAQLPIAGAGLQPHWTQALEAWWEEAYANPDETQLAFPMVNRLAEYLLRVRPHIVQALRMKECSRGAANWTTVLDRFIGVGQVPLMTVHKSKGLEFHTIIFLGLDGGSWWSLRPNSEEELKSFFVAFTRAKQRAFFTRCDERGGSIAWLERLLDPAGVTSIEGPG